MPASNRPQSRHTAAIAAGRRGRERCALLRCVLLAAALPLLLALPACVPVGGVATKPLPPTKTARHEPLTEREAAPRVGASSYDSLIASYAAAEGVPLPLAHAVVKKESGYNARARGAGTVGLMQIKPATARGIGYTGSAAGLYDPETNIKWGMKYLGGAYRLGGGDTCGTALRYQGGHRATRMTAASRRYCADLKKIMATSR